MNEILVTRKSRVHTLRSFVRNMAWSMATQVGIHGLYPWEFENHWVLMPREEIALPGLGAGFDGAKVVHLSDLHFEPLMLERYLLQHIETVNRLEPDFVVITGDFLTGSARHYARRAGAVLKELAPKVATLACLGNHDYGIWHPEWHRPVRGLADYLVDKLADAGVEPLVNETHTFRRDGAMLHFVGLADLWSGDYNPPMAMEGCSETAPVVALCHNPDATCDLAEHGADLILCGHTHGKIPPANAVNSYLFPTVRRDFVAGRYELDGGAQVYVNRGLGRSRRGQPDRKPEISVLTLRSA